jgi:hypothetical protein
MNESERLREALEKIARVASAAVHDGEQLESESVGGQEPEQASAKRFIPCTLRSLPARLLVRAAETAVKVNPVNAPVFGPLAEVADGFHVSDPLEIAVITAKYWGPSLRRLTVSFLERTPADLQARILSHMNAWSRTAGISFVLTNGIGDVRISRGPGGFYSYLGTDILHIPRNRQTMNLEGFSMSTSESEYHRVVRHETGHTLGFPHEHMRKELVARIDPEKAYAYFRLTQGWDRATVDAQVLTALDDRSIMGTPADETSIMCYQLPGSITKDGRPIRGGTDINATDFAFAGQIYPRAGRALAGVHENGRLEAEDAEVADWPEEEDVMEIEVPSSGAFAVAG